MFKRKLKERTTFKDNPDNGVYAIIKRTYSDKRWLFGIKFFDIEEDTDQNVDAKEKNNSIGFKK